MTQKTYLHSIALNENEEKELKVLRKSRVAIIDVFRCGLARMTKALNESDKTEAHSNEEQAGNSNDVV